METRKNSTTKMQIACAIIFITFTYVYLACYQADVLALAQHVLSDGMTAYSYTFAPILITLVFFLLQVGACAIIRVKRRFHGLTYFPSFLFLAMITDIPTNIDVHFSLGAWWVVIPLCLILWGGGMWVARQLEPMETEPRSHGWFSRYMWLNMMQMLTMAVLVVFISNSDRLFHERLKMEHLMTEKQYDKALKVGRNSLQTDSSLTMLRIASLQETGRLGDQLFTYPLVGGSKAMMPDSVTVKALIWKVPKWMQKPSAWMRQHHLKYRIPADYQLCALLLDKKLDQFVSTLGKYYRVDSTLLPRHYKEAMVLYTHRRSKPQVVYHDNVMDADFQDFQQMEHKYSNPTERMNAIRDTYGNTYWYYYEYGNKWRKDI